MDKILQLLKELCSHCENNLNECNKGCAWRSLSNEHCEEYEKLKEALEMKSQRYDVEKIIEDIENKIDACMEIGLGNIAHTLNEALNLIEELIGEENE